VRVRIREKPVELEVDGVALDKLAPGMIREVSASIGSWLIAQGYAELEMRSTPNRADELFFDFGISWQMASDRPGSRRRRKHGR